MHAHRSGDQKSGFALSPLCNADCPVPAIPSGIRGFRDWTHSTTLTPTLLCIAAANQNGSVLLCGSRATPSVPEAGASERFAGGKNALPLCGEP